MGNCLSVRGRQPQGIGQNNPFGPGPHMPIPQQGQPLGGMGAPAGGFIEGNDMYGPAGGRPDPQHAAAMRAQRAQMGLPPGVHGPPMFYAGPGGLMGLAGDPNPQFLTAQQMRAMKFGPGGGGDEPVGQRGRPEGLVDPMGRGARVHGAAAGSRRRGRGGGSGRSSQASQHGGGHGTGRTM
ncbi:MAG: hypothetical protein Q9166_003622 [cf. Caloplaca sp. 2 TL-2023]